jgi:hypothetical protein
VSDRLGKIADSITRLRDRVDARADWTASELARYKKIQELASKPGTKGEGVAAHAAMQRMEQAHGSLAQPKGQPTEQDLDNWLRSGKAWWKAEF